MGKIAVISGEKELLQEFIDEWYREEKEVPEIENNMNIVLPIQEKHIEGFVDYLTGFALECHIEEEK